MVATAGNDDDEKHQAAITLVSLQRLYRQQTRILYLRHASMCPNTSGACPKAFPECQGMKVLLTHINDCETKACEVRWMRRA
jgi:hypothetical protein